MKLDIDSTSYEVDAYRLGYADGGLAIELWDKTQSEIVAVLTTNLGEKLPPNCAYVDTNNFPEAEEFIRKYQLGTKQEGYDKQSGYCIYPLYEFDLSKLTEIEE